MKKIILLFTLVFSFIGVANIILEAWMLAKNKRVANNLSVTLEDEYKLSLNLDGYKRQLDLIVSSNETFKRIFTNRDVDAVKEFLTQKLDNAAISIVKIKQRGIYRKSRFKVTQDGTMRELNDTLNALFFYLAKENLLYLIQPIEIRISNDRNVKRMNVLFDLTNKVEGKQ